jgi:hypothetical protein
MWDLLKKADIDGANRELNLRRAETLRRQAEECESLEADLSALETLNELIDIFVQKYAKPPILSQAPASVPISTQKIADKPSHQHQREPHQHQHRPQSRHQTVFASFVRATSRV